MSGSSNVIPAHLVSIYRAVQGGDAVRARREWDVIYPLIDAITGAPYNAAVKAALAAVGFPVGACRLPTLGLDDAATKAIADAAAALPVLAAS